MATGKFDYDQRHPGIYVIDRFTLAIQLNQPDRNFLSLLTNPFAGAMAREVVEKFGFEELMANPAGTGPYILEKWVRGPKLSSRPIQSFKHLSGISKHPPTTL